MTRVLALMWLSATLVAGCVFQSAPATPPPAPAPTTAPAKPAASAPTVAPAAPAPTAVAAATAAAAPVAKAPALPTGPVEIVFWNITLPGQPEIVADRVKEYTAAHPNVKFQVDNLAYSDLETKLRVAMGTGAGPDLTLVNSGWLPPYAEKNNFVPISPQALGYPSLEAMRQAYIPAALDAVIYDGKIMAIPYYWNVFNLYINTAHFKEAGLDPDKDYPKTWDEVLAVGRKLTKTEGGKITRQGFRFPIVNRPNVQSSFEPILFQLGGSAIGPDGKCALNSPAGVKAMDLYASFTRQKVMDPNVSVATVPIPTLDIAKEVTSMETGHPLTVQFIRANNKAMFDSKGFKVVPYPQVDPSKPLTVMNGQTFAVNAAAGPDKIAVAQDFLRTLIARPNEWLARVGAIAPIKALLETPEATTFPYLDVILNDMKYGRHITLSKFAAEISEGEFRAVQAVLLSSVDSKRALDEACVEINRAIGY